MSSTSHEPSSILNRLPSLDSLRFFREVARHGSLSLAAGTLHLTQSAVSHRLRALEEALGLRLFLRGRRGVVPTDEGRLLLEATEEGLGRIEQGLLRLLQRAPSPALTLRCSPSFAIRWLVPHLPELRSRHPELEVRIAVSDGAGLAPEGTDELDLRFGPPAPDQIPLGAVRMLAVCSPSLAQGRHPIRRFEDLRAHTLLHDEVLRDHPGWIGWRRWLELAGAGELPVERGLRFSHSYLAIEAALAGQGVALARSVLVARDLREGRLCRPLPFAPRSPLGYHLRRPASPSPAQRVIIDWLLEAVARDADPTTEPAPCAP